MPKALESPLLLFNISSWGSWELESQGTRTTQSCYLGIMRVTPRRCCLLTPPETILPMPPSC